MAGGVAILGTTVVAPIIAIAGWAYNAHAEEKLRQVEKYEAKVEKAVVTMGAAIDKHQEIGEYIRLIREQLERIYALFLPNFQELRTISELIEKYGEAILDRMSDLTMLYIGNGYAIASILTDIMTTPLFKFKKDADGRIIEQDSLPVLLKDNNGLQVVNKEGIVKTLMVAQKDSLPFEK